MYNFVNGSGSTTVTVNNPPKSGPNTSNNSAIEVIIAQPQSLLVAVPFLAKAPTIQARSVALGPIGNGCVLALNKANVTDDSLSGGVTLNLNSCSLYMGSSQNLSQNAL